MKDVVVIGAGGHSKVVIATLLEVGHRVVAAYDDDPSKMGTEILGVPVEGSTTRIATSFSGFAVLAIGDNRIRRRVASELEMDWLYVVHPRASVHPSVELGPGTVVFAGAVIQPDTMIGAHAIVNTGATVDHDCDIGDFAHVAPGCHLAGQVRVGEGATLGIGSTVIPGCSVGAWAILGAGGVVVSDLPSGIVATGVPARKKESE